MLIPPGTTPTGLKGWLQPAVPSRRRRGAFSSVAFLSALSVLLFGTGCDPPERPTIAAIEIGPTYISGISSPCVDDGIQNPPGCVQELLVTPSTAAMVRSIAGGAWTVSGLFPSTQYTVHVASANGQGSAVSTPITVTTASTGGPKIVGVAPTEIVVPNDSVWISGSFVGAGAISVKLVDSTTGQVRPVPVEGVEPNRIRVSIVRPSDLDGRRRYFLQVNANNKAHILADVVYLSSSGIHLPPGQSIRVQLVRWQWVAFCDTSVAPCPCILQNSFTQVNYQPLYDPWPDTWPSSQWSRFRSHFDDTTREWSAMCSEARGAQPRVGGLTEPNPRVTLPNSSFYQLEIATDSWDMALLANRQKNSNPPSDYCTPTFFIWASWAPPDCTNWLPNQNGRINVHLVGKFRFFGEEVDPATGPRGIADPPNIFTTNTRGMVVLTDNPFFQARPMPKELTFFCPSQFPDFWASNAPINSTFWWGGPIPMQRSTEPTPNLLSHELHHVTTGYAHGATDPCFTPAVGDPNAICPRGFDMDLGVNSTVASECQKVINGVGGRDYTQ